MTEELCKTVSSKNLDSFTRSFALLLEGSASGKDKSGGANWTRADSLILEPQVPLDFADL